MKQDWLVLSHGFNMDGRAASQTITDKIPHLLARGIKPIVLSAVTEKISALTAEAYLRKRADRANPAAFQAILNKVPRRAPLAGDE